MFGSDSRLGIAHFAIQDIFKLVDSYEERELVAKVYISFYQVYLEQVFDLLYLGDKPQSLNIRENNTAGNNSVFIENLRQFFVKDEATAFELVQQGLRNRKVFSTAYNMRSSRSHAILQLYIDLEEEVPAGEEKKDNSMGVSGNGPSLEQRYKVRRRTLTLVDLAGSERIPTYKQASKQTLAEATAINKSISALGNCISALANAKSTGASPHVPYRNCKLTWLLAPWIGGNARVCMITNINPCTYAMEESMSTLKFASRAKLIRKVITKAVAVDITARAEYLPYFSGLTMQGGQKVAAGSSSPPGQVSNAYQQDQSGYTQPRNEPLQTFHHVRGTHGNLPGTRSRANSTGDRSTRSALTMSSAPAGFVGEDRDQYHDEYEGEGELEDAMEDNASGYARTTISSHPTGYGNHHLHQTLQQQQYTYSQKPQQYSSPNRLAQSIAQLPSMQAYYSSPQPTVEYNEHRKQPQLPAFSPAGTHQSTSRNEAFSLREFLRACTLASRLAQAQEQVPGMLSTMSPPPQPQHLQQPMMQPSPYPHGHNMGSENSYTQNNQEFWSPPSPLQPPPDYHSLVNSPDSKPSKPTLHLDCPPPPPDVNGRLFGDHDDDNGARQLDEDDPRQVSSDLSSPTPRVLSSAVEGATAVHGIHPLSPAISASHDDYQFTLRGSLAADSIAIHNDVADTKISYLPLVPEFEGGLEHNSSFILPTSSAASPRPTLSVKRLANAINSQSIQQASSLQQKSKQESIQKQEAEQQPAPTHPSSSKTTTSKTTPSKQGSTSDKRIHIKKELLSIAVEDPDDPEVLEMLSTGPLSVQLRLQHRRLHHVELEGEGDIYGGGFNSQRNSPQDSTAANSTATNTAINAAVSADSASSQPFLLQQQRVFFADAPSSSVGSRNVAPHLVAPAAMVSRSTNTTPPPSAPPVSSSTGTEASVPNGSTNGVRTVQSRDRSVQTTSILPPTPSLVRGRNHHVGTLNDFDAFLPSGALPVDDHTQTEPEVLLVAANYFGRDPEDHAALRELAQLDPVEMAWRLLDLQKTVRIILF